MVVVVVNGLARGGAVVIAPGPRLPEFVIRVAVLPVLVLVVRKPSDDQQFRLIVSIAIAAIVVTARLQEDSTMVVLQLPFNWLTTSYSFAYSYGVVSKGTVPHHLFVSFADDRNQHEMYTVFVRNASLAKRSRGHTELFSDRQLTFALNIIVKMD